MIPESWLKTLQLVILLGTDGLKINSIENLSGLNYSDGINFDATLANKYSLAFCILGTEEILKASKWEVNSWTNYW